MVYNNLPESIVEVIFNFTGARTSFNSFMNELKSALLFVLENILQVGCIGASEDQLKMLIEHSISTELEQEIKNRCRSWIFPT